MTKETPGTGGDQPTPRELRTGHRQELEASVISDAVIGARGYETLDGTDDDRSRLKDLRIPRWAWREDFAFPGILMPMYRVTGEEIGAQWKPAIPQEAPGGKMEKYASQAGVPNRLDVPPSVSDAVRDPSNALWITEGIKKGDCLASQGRPVVTLTGVFNWRSKMGTLGDWEDVPLRNRAVIICFDSDARSNRNVMLAMARLGRWLESKGATDVRYLIVPEEVNGQHVKGVDDFFAAGGTMETLASAALTALPSEAQDATFTDAVLAESVTSEELDERFRWAPGMGWMEWTGKVWKESNEVSVTEAVRQWVLEQYHQASDRVVSNTGRDPQASAKGWFGVLSAGRIGSIVRLAKGILAIPADAFDGNPDLINCQNGIVDLRTGALQPHDPDLLMTKITAADFVKDAEHPDWTKALLALPEDVIEWFQLRVGQAITGHMTPDDVVIICQGGGSNGKSTVYDVMSIAIGKYHTQVSDRAMLGGASDNHPTEIMDLMGARYAVLEETPEARRLDTNRLKKLSGTREITGRRIRQDPVTFAATHTLFVNSNYEPVVDETDHGTWRRLALLKWPFTFRDSLAECVGPRDRVGDPTLRDRMKLDPQAQEAALAWVAAGARRWYEMEKIMPPMPQQVIEDTLEWRKKADLILAFIPDEIEFDLSRYVTSTELRTVFNERLRERGQKEWSEKTFSARFGGHDTVVQRGVHYKVVKASTALSTKKLERPTATTVRAWVGVKFKTDPGTTGKTGETDNPVNDPFRGPETSPVTAVTPDPITFPAPARAYVNDSAVTAVTGEETPVSEDRYAVDSRAVQPRTAEGNFASTDPYFVSLGHGPAKQDQSDGESMIEFDPADLIDPFAEDLPEASPSGPENEPLEDVPGAIPEASPDPAGQALAAFSVEGDVGFDLETGAAEELFTYGPGFVRIGGLINEAGETVTTADIPALVGKINNADSVYGHNILGFDGLALAYWHGLDWEAFCAKATDTDPLSRAAFPPRSRVHGSADAYDLNHVAERYGVTGKTDDLKRLKKIHGGYDKIPKDDPEYNAYLVGDVQASRHIRKVLPENDYTRREHKIAAMMGRMTLNGFKVDQELLHQRYDEGQAKKKAAEGELSDSYGLQLGKTVMRGRGKAKHEVFEASKSPLATTEGNAWVKRLWETYGVTKPPRTAEGHLSTKAVELDKIANHPRCPAELKNILGLMRTVTTTRTVYATALKYLAADGRVHPFVSMRQASGRASITDPGMTVYGKHDGKHIERAVFVADEGEVLITCDASQVDMRAIAGHCQDPAYMALFQPGRDAHQEIADLLGISRQDAKARGHGWNYGLGANAMIRDGADPEVVYAFVNGMKERFPRLIEWREQVREQGGRGELLDNGFGRMMRCDPQQAYTVAPALMGQGGARDLVCDALLRLPEAYWPYLRTFVHDEIVMSVPADRAEEIMAVVKDAFTTTWQNVPILADTTGPALDWGTASAK
jgi:P4 family phage/plasmid primase-like protien